MRSAQRGSAKLLILHRFYSVFWLLRWRLDRLRPGKYTPLGSSVGIKGVLLLYLKTNTSLLHARDLTRPRPQGLGEFYIGFINILRFPWSPRKLQQDPQMAPRWPTWGPKVLPGTFQEAYVFLAPNGGLAEHVPNRKWCALHRFYKLFWASLRTLTLTL